MQVCPSTYRGLVLSKGRVRVCFGPPVSPFRLRACECCVAQHFPSPGLGPRIPEIHTPLGAFTAPEAPRPDLACRRIQGPLGCPPSASRRAATGAITAHQSYHRCRRPRPLSRSSMTANPSGSRLEPSSGHSAMALLAWAVCVTSPESTGGGGGERGPSETEMDMAESGEGQDHGTQRKRGGDAQRAAETAETAKTDSAQAAGATEERRMSATVTTVPRV